MAGIPMGSDPAPVIAKLFLCYSEDKQLRKTNKKDHETARKFNSFFPSN